MQTDDKLAKLQKGVKDAIKVLMTSSADKLLDAFNAKLKAEKELLEYENSLISPEEIAAKEYYEECKNKAEIAKNILDAAAEQLRKYKKVGTLQATSERRTAVGPAPKATIDANLDLIKQMAKEGKGPTEIGKALGFTKEQGYCGNSIRPLIAAAKAA